MYCHKYIIIRHRLIFTDKSFRMHGMNCTFLIWYCYGLAFLILIKQFFGVYFPYWLYVIVNFIQYKHIVLTMTTIIRFTSELFFITSRMYISPISPLLMFNQFIGDIFNKVLNMICWVHVMNSLFHIERAMITH